MVTSNQYSGNTHPLVRHLFRKELKSESRIRDITHKEMRDWLSTPVAHHMLDSGDFYGRQYDRNAHKNFLRTPAVHYEFDYIRERRPVTSADMMYTVELYHFLMATCGFDEITDTVNEHMKAHPEDEGLTDAQIEGGHNTYNECNTVLSNLSGVFLHVAGAFGEDLEDSERVYVSISIHGGCDVRGGYQDGKLVVLKVPYSSFVAGAEVFMYWEEFEYSDEVYRNGVSTMYDGHTLRWENGEYVTIVDYMEYMEHLVRSDDNVTDTGELSDDAECASGRFGGYVPVMPEKVLPQITLYISQ